MGLESSLAGGRVAGEREAEELSVEERYRRSGPMGGLRVAWKALRDLAASVSAAPGWETGGARVAASWAEPRRAALSCGWKGLAPSGPALAQPAEGGSDSGVSVAAVEPAFGCGGWREVSYAW